MHHLLLIIHVFAATVWVGGHLILSMAFLPRALKHKNPAIITHFEKAYEKTGLPALLALVITGVMLSYNYNIAITRWFSFKSAVEKVISIKLILLCCTLGLAIHARSFIIPRLSAKTLPIIAIHIVLITLIAIGMMVLGTFVRFGGI